MSYQHSRFSITKSRKSIKYMSQDRQLLKKKLRKVSSWAVVIGQNLPDFFFFKGKHIQSFVYINS